MRTWKSKFTLIVLLGFLLTACSLVEDKTITPLEGENELVITPTGSGSDVKIQVCGQIDSKPTCVSAWDGQFRWPEEDEFIDESIPETGSVRFTWGNPTSILVQFHKSHYKELTDPLN